MRTVRSSVVRRLAVTAGVAVAAWLAAGAPIHVGM